MLVGSMTLDLFRNSLTEIIAESLLLH